MRWYLRDRISETIRDKCIKCGKCTCLVILFEWVVLNELQNLAGPIYSHNYAIAWDTVKVCLLHVILRESLTFSRPVASQISRDQGCCESKSQRISPQQIKPRSHPNESHLDHTPANHTPITLSQSLASQSHPSQSHPDPGPITPAST